MNRKMRYGIAAVIRIRRKELRIPLWLVALETSISIDTLNRLESGYLDPDLLTFRRVANCLKMRSQDILEIADQLERMLNESENRLKSRRRNRAQMELLLLQSDRLLQQLRDIDRNRIDSAIPNRPRLVQIKSKLDSRRWHVVKSKQHD